MTDDASLPPFPFDELPPLADVPRDGESLPSWLSPDGRGDAVEPSQPSLPYWPNFGGEAVAANARLNDTLADCPRPVDELPPLSPLPEQSLPTELLVPGRRKRSRSKAEELPMPPPYSAGLSELSPFLPQRPEPESIADSQPLPALAKTPPPAQPLEIPPASAIWRTRRIVSAPSLEDGESIAVFRTVVRDEAGRGYVNAKVSFELPPGIKQVQASRKPIARKGALHWTLGALAASETVALSVKIPVSLLGGVETAALPRVYEVAYQPLPGAVLAVQLKAPSSVPVGESFTVAVTVGNAGELPSGNVAVRVLDRTSGGRPVTVALPPIDPGATRSANVELVSPVEGTHQWLAIAESSGSEPHEHHFATESVRAALSVELRHESTVRVDRDETIVLAIRNDSPVIARGVAAQLSVPEELLYESSKGGHYDRAANAIGWSVGDIPAGGTRTVEAKLKGFSPGFVGLHARVESQSGAVGTVSSNLFVEIDARANSSSLDKLLAAIATDTVDEADDVRERPVETGARHLVFDLGGSHYAVAIDHIREVLRPGMYTPVPGTPAWMPGVANIRGDIVTLVDLPRYLGFPVSEGALRGMIVAQSEDGRTTTGLLVNDIVGIRRLAESGEIDRGRFPDNPVLPYVEGVAELGSRLVPVVRIGQLLRDAENGAGSIA